MGAEAEAEARAEAEAEAQAEAQGEAKAQGETMPDLRMRTPMLSFVSFSHQGALSRKLRLTDKLKSRIRRGQRHSVALYVAAVGVVHGVGAALDLGNCCFNSK